MLMCHHYYKHGRKLEFQMIFLENYKNLVKLQHFSNTLCKNCSTKPVKNRKHWKVNFITSIFQVGNSWKIYEKRSISMCCNSSCTGQKLMKLKINVNLIFTLPLKLLILIIDNAESCFFLPLLNPLFLIAAT